MVKVSKKIPLELYIQHKGTSIDGLVDATLAQWVDALRVLGNEGAHYTGKQVPRDDAEDALAFAEALLDHIYVLRKRFDKFAARRASKKSDREADDSTQ